MYCMERTFRALKTWFKWFFLSKNCFHHTTNRWFNSHHSSLLFSVFQANSVLRYLERQEGDSVVLSCVIAPNDPSPFGVYLLHGCQHPVQVLFMLTNNEFTAGKNEDKERISVRGDPGSHLLNVTISQLTANDTGCYFCEFVVENPSSEDLKLPGQNHFFLNVRDGEFPLSCISTVWKPQGDKINFCSQQKCRVGTSKYTGEEFGALKFL